MAITSKMVYPFMINEADSDAAERLREISKYMLLNVGLPSDWGQLNQTTPEAFGLARSDFANYQLDIDKVSRLNSKNAYSIGYVQAFTSLNVPDVSFRIGIKPVFDIDVNLTRTITQGSETTYEFVILTKKHGSFVQTFLKCYLVADDYLNSTATEFSDGLSYQNVTLSNSSAGPALLVVFARSSCDAKLVSFNAYAFSHNLPVPKPNGSYLKLSPIDQKLNATLLSSNTSLSDTYALTYDFNSTLTVTANNSQSAIFNIPHFVDLSPTILVATGLNATDFFVEWTAYPQIPLQMGANFDSSLNAASVLAFTYLVTVDRVCYECTVWLGGTKQ
jgi:hypothetical protein